MLSSVPTDQDHVSCRLLAASLRYEVDLDYILVCLLFITTVMKAMFCSNLCLSMSVCLCVCLQNISERISVIFSRNNAYMVGTN